MIVANQPGVRSKDHARQEPSERESSGTRVPKTDSLDARASAARVLTGRGGLSRVQATTVETNMEKMLRASKTRRGSRGNNLAAAKNKLEAFNKTWKMKRKLWRNLKGPLHCGLNSGQCQDQGVQETQHVEKNVGTKLRPNTSSRRYWTSHHITYIYIYTIDMDTCI